ncbi:MAG: hypothetical protein NC320_10830 [Clostridium sp.]|nr:hypothetical protein [Clostridium sp.]
MSLNKHNMLEDLASVSFECKKYGIPLLAMMYVRNNKNETILDMSKITHSVRIATELGADIVKIPFPENYENLQYIVKTSLIPIVVAGGHEILDDRRLCTKTKLIIESGAVGICYGRNIIKSHNPRLTISNLKAITLTK